MSAEPESPDTHAPDSGGFGTRRTKPPLPMRSDLMVWSRTGEDPAQSLLFSAVRAFEKVEKDRRRSNKALAEFLGMGRNHIGRHLAALESRGDIRKGRKGWETVAVQCADRRVAGWAPLWLFRTPLEAGAQVVASVIHKLDQKNADRGCDAGADYIGRELGQKRSWVDAQLAKLRKRDALGQGPALSSKSARKRWLKRPAEAQNCTNRWDVFNTPAAVQNCTNRGDGNCTNREREAAATAPIAGTTGVRPEVYRSSEPAGLPPPGSPEERTIPEKAPEQRRREPYRPARTHTPAAKIREGSPDTGKGPVRVIGEALEALGIHSCSVKVAERMHAAGATVEDVELLHELAKRKARPGTAAGWLANELWDPGRVEALILEARALAAGTDAVPELVAELTTGTVPATRVPEAAGVGGQAAREAVQAMKVEEHQARRPRFMRAPPDAAARAQSGQRAGDALEELRRQVAQTEAVSQRQEMTEELATLIRRIPIGGDPTRVLQVVSPENYSRADDGSWSVPVGLGDREVFGRHEVVWIRDQLESWFGEEILICAEEVFGTPSDLGPKGFGFLDPLYRRRHFNQRQSMVQMTGARSGEPITFRRRAIDATRAVADSTPSRPAGPIEWLMSASLERDPQRRREICRHAAKLLADDPRRVELATEICRTYFGGKVRVEPVAGGVAPGGARTAPAMAPPSGDNYGKDGAGLEDGPAEQDASDAAQVLAEAARLAAELVDVLSRGISMLSKNGRGDSEAAESMRAARRGRTAPLEFSAKPDPFRALLAGSDAFRGASPDEVGAIKQFSAEWDQHQQSGKKPETIAVGQPGIPEAPAAAAVGVAEPDTNKDTSKDTEGAGDSAGERFLRVPELCSPELPEPDTYWYWTGLLPFAPINGAHTHNVTWAKVSEAIRWVDDGRKMKRFPHAGMLIALTRADLEQIADKLSRQFVRIIKRAKIGPMDLSYDPGRGDPDPSATNGVVMMIPREEDEEEYAKHFGARRLPIRMQYGDVPLSKYVYIVPCNEQRPQPRPTTWPLPKCVAETGIELPSIDPVLQGTPPGWDNGSDLKRKRIEMIRTTPFFPLLVEAVGERAAEEIGDWIITSGTRAKGEKPPHSIAFTGAGAEALAELASLILAAHADIRVFYLGEHVAYAPAVAVVLHSEPAVEEQRIRRMEELAAHTAVLFAGDVYTPTVEDTAVYSLNLAAWAEESNMETVPVTPTDFPVTFTIEDTASAFGVSPSAIRSRMQSRTLPSLRIGRRLVILSQDVPRGFGSVGKEDGRDQIAHLFLDRRTLRPDEVANVLGVSKRTIYRMLRDGEIPGDRETGPWTIPAAEFRNWLREHRQPARWEGQGAA
eukprot:g15846.t1